MAEAGTSRSDCWDVGCQFCGDSGDPSKEDAIPRWIRRAFEEAGLGGEVNPKAVHKRQHLEMFTERCGVQILQTTRGCLCSKTELRSSSGQ